MKGDAKKFLVVNVVVAALVGAFIMTTLLAVVTSKAYAQAEPVAAAQQEQAAEKTGGGDAAMAYLSAAIVTCVSCVAAGVAVGMTGSAAIGAIAERPEVMGRTIPIIGLAEGIAIYGLIVAIVILLKV